MREILFRGKRIGYNEWVEGHLVALPKNPYIIDEKGDVYILNPQTVGQFTGLLDKNAKKVFEGDIVKYTPRPNCEIIYEVIWQQECIRFSLVQWSTHKYNLWEWDEETKVKYMCEVIGNIHDNPELLEVNQ